MTVAPQESKGDYMKANRTQKWLSAGMFAFFVLFSGAGLNLTVQAQDDRYRNPYPQDDRYRNQGRRGNSGDNYGNYGGSFELRQTALNAGYNEGLKDGTAARQKNRNADFQNQSAYRKATKDYSSRLGDRELYQRYFREAYQNAFNYGFNPQGTGVGYDPYGYDPYGNNSNRTRRNDNRDWNNNRNRRGRDWDQYDNYGGSFELRQTALNAGYNEGIKQGRNDRKRNRNSDFRNNSAYQNATEDYSSKLGDRGLYQRYYRTGYENGYYAGVNGYKTLQANRLISADLCGTIA
jgi:hypothetical protein